MAVEMTARRSFLKALVLAVLVALGGGCDSSFEPYKKSERSFSLFGIIDAGSQRHPVLVEPLQDDRPFTADSTIDATGTITNVETGREVALERQRRQIGGGFRHNFIVKMKPQRGATYRLTVRPSDGKASTATLTMPNSAPRLSLIARETVDEGMDLRAIVEETGQDRLLFLIVNYRVRIKPKRQRPDAPPPEPFEAILTAQYGTEASRTDTGYSTVLDWKSDVKEAYEGQSATSATLLAINARAGIVHSSAPEYGGLTYDELFELGTAPSNVENGYGYVAGTASDGASVTIEGEPTTVL
jgi:hypothetical protein